jgi:hypothetical protein
MKRFHTAIAGLMLIGASHVAVAAHGPAKTGGMMNMDANGDGMQPGMMGPGSGKGGMNAGGQMMEKPKNAP